MPHHTQALKLTEKYHDDTPATDRALAAAYFTAVWPVGIALVFGLFAAALWAFGQVAAPVSDLLYWLATATGGWVRGMF